MTLENVVLLPHLGSAETETRDAMGRIVLGGIGAILAGRRRPIRWREVGTFVTLVVADCQGLDRNRKQAGF